MELRVEAAYYREGSPTRDMASYVGSQSVTYQVATDGTLIAGAVSSFLKDHPEKKQPRNQPAVERLIPARNLRYRYHRLFFQLAMSRTGPTHPAVLMGSRSKAELDRSTSEFLQARSVCGRHPATQCLEFPGFSTASIGIEIMLNGVARKVTWGSTVGSVAGHPRSIELVRDSNGRLTPVPVDIADPEALRLPLMHGDRLSWR